MANHLLKYKTFDQLVSEVKGDFENYNLHNRIKNHQLIKVAKRVNYSLGLKIQKTKNVILEVENGRVQLPEDFHLVNYIYGLGHYESIDAMPQGTHVEEVPLAAPTYFPGPVNGAIDICATPDPCPVPDPCPDPCDPCQAPDPCGCNSCGCSTWMNCKGQEMTLIQKIKYRTRKWSEFYKIQMVGDNQYYDPLCPNLSWQCGQTGFIRDGWMFMSFKEGQIYLNYQGMMEDGDGNLLVLDHDEINNYYEYALKKKIIEILLGSDEPVNQTFISIVHKEFKDARTTAIGIVRTPSFNELKNVWAANRKAQFNKYYKMFT